MRDDLQVNLKDQGRFSSHHLQGAGYIVAAILQAAQLVLHFQPGHLTWRDLV